MTTPKSITHEDILPFDDYASTRKERKKALMAVKKNRRMEVGPHASFYFENYETMWNQIHACSLQSTDPSRVGTGCYGDV
jgi:hypothetical protein